MTSAVSAREGAMDGNCRTYRVHAFAALTGVSVRALHHSDRLDLLRPRAASQYRIYGADDEAILEQIVALKFIGIPRGDIERLLRTEPGESRKVLAAPRALPAATLTLDNARITREIEKGQSRTRTKR